MGETVAADHGHGIAYRGEPEQDPPPPPACQLVRDGLNAEQEERQGGAEDRPPVGPVQDAQLRDTPHEAAGAEGRDRAVHERGGRRARVREAQHCRRGAGRAEEGRRCREAGRGRDRPGAKVAPQPGAAGGEQGAETGEGNRHERQPRGGLDEIPVGVSCQKQGRQGNRAPEQV